MRAGGSMAGRRVRAAGLAAAAVGALAGVVLLISCGRAQTAGAQRPERVVGKADSEDLGSESDVRPTIDEALSYPDMEVADDESLGLDAFVEEAIQASLETAEARLRVPPHPWQKQRVENITRERTEELIEHLADFDDMLLAQTSFSSIVVSCMSIMSQTALVTRLARVRRLLEMGRENPSVVIPSLRRALRQATADWPGAWRDTVERYARGENSRAAPWPSDKVLARGLAATYLLAELDDHKSLPLLLESLPPLDWLTDESMPDSNESPPITPPGMTLYAMYRLVESYPTDKLNAEARRLRDECLRSARQLLPPPKEITVMRWDAEYDETDPRIVIGDPQGRVLVDQSTMKMTKWPYEFTDGKLLNGMGGEISERCAGLFEQLERFIVAADPESHFP